MHHFSNATIVRLTILLIFVTIFGCTKEQFSATKQTQTNTTGALVSSVYDEMRSSFTTINPKVDFVILWDNSGSANHLTDEQKRQYRDLILKISKDFDVHILIAPLFNGSEAIQNPTEDQVNKYSYISKANSKDNFEFTGLAGEYSKSSDRKTDVQFIPIKLDGYKNIDANKSSAEHGLKRMHELVSYNSGQSQTNDGNAGYSNVLRQKANLIMLTMSGGDDFIRANGDSGYIDYKKSNDNFDNYRAKLLQLRNSRLQSSSFRYFSLVSHQLEANCDPERKFSGVIKNKYYKNMSQSIYTTSYENGDSNLGDSSSSPDSYDLCRSSEYNSIFSGINNTIKKVVVNHVYKYWPVADAVTPTSSVDPKSIEVLKSNGSILPKSEWTFLGKTSKDLRSEPTKGEPFSGYIIELKTAITYPDYLIVKRKDYPAYYGYIHIPIKPYEQSIEVKIDGQKIPQSSTFGWEYVGYRENLNIKIKGSNNYEGDVIGPIIKTGYFLKLNGNAVYSNSAKVEIAYSPSS